MSASKSSSIPSTKVNTGTYHHLSLGLLAVLGASATEAAAIAARSTFEASFRKKRGPRRKLRPSAQTPLWNALAVELRRALLPYGSKTRLARHLGLPRQRLNDFLKAGTRVPDGEMTLRLLHWLGERQAGRDPSALVPADPKAFPPGKV